MFSSGRKGWIGMLAESFNQWETRAPLTPFTLKRLKKLDPSLTVLVQPSTRRVFSDHQYEEAGAIITNDLSPASLLIGIKPPAKLIPNRTYAFFSHFLKTKNFLLLDEIIAKQIRLMDYRKIKNEKGERLASFSHFAGCVGAINLLSGFGNYLLSKGINTPFVNISLSYSFVNFEQAQNHLNRVGRNIEHEELPSSITPMVIGILGSGQMAKGIMCVLEQLPSTFIEPQEIETVLSDPSNPIHRKSIYVCVFRKKDIFENKETKGFEEIEYKMNPERYRSTFHEKYLSKCTIIFNCLLWDIRYPRVVSSDQLKAAWLGGGCRLNAIGDLTSDLEGSFEMSKKFSETDSHFFIWDPVRQIVIDDVNKSEKGILYLNSDNLATEFPSDSSKAFSHDLLPFLSPVAHSDIALHPEKADLPPPMLNATMVWNGALLPKYAYINRVREQFSQAHESFKAEVKPKITRNGQGDYELALRFTGHLFDSRFIIAFMNTLEQQTEGTVSSEFLGWDVRMNQWEKSTLRLRFRSGWISNILRAVEEIRRLAVPANIEIHFEK